MSRYSGFQFPDGVAVLDRATGLLVYYPIDGGEARVIREADAMGTSETLAPSSSFTGDERAPEVVRVATAERAAARASLGPGGGAPRSRQADTDPGLRRSARLRRPDADASEEAVPEGSTGDEAPAEPVPDALGDALDREAPDKRVLSEYPYSVARRYRDFAVEGDPRRACRQMVAAARALLRLLATIAAADALSDSGAPDVELLAVLRRGLQRPSLATWAEALHRGVAALERSGREPFCPALLTAYDRLERRCAEPFVLDGTAEGGSAPGRRVRMGKIAALVAYREALDDGFAFARERAEADLATYGPILREWLAATDFLTEYTLVAALDPADDGAAPHGLPATGLEPASEPVPLSPDTRPGAVVLRHASTGRQLDLLDLIVRADEVSPPVPLPGLAGDLAAHERRVGDRVLYRSVGDRAVARSVGEVAWLARLAARSAGARGAMTTTDRAALGEAAARATRRTLAELTASDHLREDLLLPRPPLEEDLSLFESGQAAALALVGDPGSGKTSLLARYALDRQATGDLVVLLRGATLYGRSLVAALGEALDVEAGDLGALLDGLSPHLRTPEQPQTRDTIGPHLLLILDGLDETPDRVEALAEAVDELVERAAEHRWLRLVVSLSAASWARLPHAVRPGRDGDRRWFRVGCWRDTMPVECARVVVTPLSEHRLATYYEGFRLYRGPEGGEGKPGALFRPRTAFAALDSEGSTVGVLRLPLMLRLALRVFHGQELPSSLTSRQLIRRFLDGVVGDGEPGRDGAAHRRAALEAFVREVDARGCALVPRADLEDVDKLGVFVRQAESDSPYTQLLNGGVLSETWSGDTCLVGFWHESLLAWLLSEQYAPLVKTADDVRKLAARTIAFPALAGALERLLQRACDTDGSPLLRTLVLSLPLDSGDSVDEALALGLIGALVGLARERDPRLDAALAALAAAASAPAVRVLRGVAEALSARGLLAEQRRILQTALALAEALEDRALRAATRCDLAIATAEDGDLEGALAEVERALGEAEEADDMARLGRVKLLQALLQERLGDFEGAAASAATAFAALEPVETTGLAAKARLLQAQLAARMGAAETAITWLRDGLERAERAGRVLLAAEAVRDFALRTVDGDTRRALVALVEPALESVRASGRIGWLAPALGRLAAVSRYHDPRGAEAHLRRALALAERLEQRREIPGLFGLLGDLLLGLGRAREAERVLSRALELAEARPADADRWRTLLVRVQLERGELAGLEASLQRAIREAQRDDRPEVEALATATLAGYHFAKGRLAQAEDYFRRARDRFVALGDPDAEGEALLNLAAVAARRGEWEGAEARWSELRALGERLGNTWLVGAALDGLTELAAARHDRDASASLGALSSLATELEHPRLAQRATTRRGQLTRRRGALDEAARAWTDALQQADHLGLAPIAARARLGLARVHLDAERLGPAHEEAHAALSYFEAHEHDLDLADALGVEGVCDELGGRLDAAEEAFERQRSLAAALGYDPGLAAGLRHGAEVAYARGDLEAGDTRHRRFVEMTEGLPQYGLGRAALALRAAVAGDDPEAVHAAEATLRDAEANERLQCGLDESATLTWRAAARFWEKRGDEEKAEAARHASDAGRRD